METIKLWARNGEAVRQAIELGALVHPRHRERRID
jgi:hypothetical protein